MNASDPASDPAATPAPARPARTGPPAKLRLVPREHGASFMSVHTLLLGIVAGFTTVGLTQGARSWTGLVLSLAFGTLILPLTAAVSVWSHPKLAAAARRRAALLLAIFAALGLLSLWHGPAVELLTLGVVGAVGAGAYALARARTAARSMPTELVAIACIALLAPLAWLLIAGARGPWQLSAPLSFLAFGGTVPYVRERVHRRRESGATVTARLRSGATAIAWQAVALAVSVGLVVAGIVDALVAVAYLPGAVKVLIALALPERKPPLKKIGYLETAISTAFAVLAGLGLGLAP